jgi:hypothetical protein
MSKLKYIVDVIGGFAIFPSYIGEMIHSEPNETSPSVGAKEMKS